MGYISFDTETTTNDLWHGGLPFSMQGCDDRGTIFFVQWDVDPFTRLPAIDPGDLEEVIEWLEPYQNWVLHSAKFDIRALLVACRRCSIQPPPINWNQIQDTLIKSHVLRNLWSHSLKDLREIFFGVTRDKQTALKLATNQARNICRSKDFIAAHGQWRIADEYDPHWPSIGRAPDEKEEDIEGWWLFDTWLPHTIARLAPEFLPPSPENPHPWWNVLREYAIEDAETEVVINEVLDDALEREGLTYISQERHRLLEITFNMEQEGTRLIVPTIKSEIDRYTHESQASGRAVKQIAEKYGLEDFNPASPKQLKSLLYENWKLPILKRTDSSKTHPQGQPSTDNETIQSLIGIVKENPPIHLRAYSGVITDFLSGLVNGKRNEKSAEYLRSYLAWGVLGRPGKGFRLHPNINITGTKFTRQSNNSPNLQNVGTGKDVYTDDGEKYTDFLLRTCFGPSPQEEWLSIDFQSIEFFIWGFSCGNEEIRRVYEAGLSPFKPVMEAVWGFFNKEDRKYKRTKNGIYSRIYGASNRHADNTFGCEGAVAAIEDRMPEIKPFTQKLYKQVKAKGYIETLSGYRLYCEESEPHKAVSAYVQGHAGYVIGEAMKACYNYVRDFPTIRIILQIHDELIFQGPKGFHKQHADKLASLMSQSGEKYGIPTPTNKSLITHNWGEAESI